MTVPVIAKQVPVTSSKAKAKPIVKKKSGGGVLSRISDVSFDDAEGISILIYGESGTGKTRTWSTFPGKILSIVCSNGNKKGELRSISVEDRKKIKQVVLETPAEFLDLMEMLEEDAGQTYKTVVLDHVSGFQDLVLTEILGRPVPEQKSWGLCSREDWGVCSGRCKDGLRKMLNLSINRVIVGQEKRKEENEESELEYPTVGVALIPTLAGWLYPACDYICQTFRKGKTQKVVQTIGKGKAAKQIERIKSIPGTDFCARIGPHSVVQTKWRVPRGVDIPDYIVDPDYDKFMEIINGG